MPWGGVWDVLILQITPYPEYNFFFTLVAVAGLVAVMLNMVIRVISRS
jgi:hypothetical protein